MDKIEKMKELIQKLKAEYDVVIIDGAPVLPVTDSVILSSIVDRVVVVVSTGETHRDELKSVKQTLDGAGANIAGVVLNKVDMKSKGYGKYSKYSKGYYGAYYGEEEKKSKKA